ncbi:hypothetical protein ACRTDU_03965 [Sunxiuqinia elliptica]
MYSRRFINDLLDLYQKAIKSKSGNKHYLNLNPLTKKQASSISQLLGGIDVSEFQHSIDESGIRHALKHREISVSDILLIPLVISDYDKVYAGNKPHTLVYEKNFVDTVVYIEEVRQGRKKLVLKTMYKKKLKP